MKEITRRGFTQASVVGAAAAVVGVSSLASGASAAESPSSQSSPPSDLKIRGAAPEDVVVHIRDAGSSEVAIIAGEEEFVYHDARLVSSVLSKFNKSTKE